jgi:vacuolar-type H+-ATPase subunit E/Vma4
VAIDDIVAKIAEDAEAEAAVLVAEAEAEAARVTTDARARADAGATRVRAREHMLAERDAATVLAGARLAARDATLTARSAADGAVLEKAVKALEALPDPEYAAFIAREVAISATAEDTLLVGSADEDRVRTALPGALAEAGAAQITIGGRAPDTDRGVVVEGVRMRSVISPSAMVAERRDGLLAVADGALFGPED